MCGRTETKTWYISSIVCLKFQEEMKPYSKAVKKYWSLFHQFASRFWALFWSYKCNFLVASVHIQSNEGPNLTPKYCLPYDFSCLFSTANQVKQEMMHFTCLLIKAPSLALLVEVPGLLLLGCIIQWSRALSTQWEPKRWRGSHQHFMNLWVQWLCGLQKDCWFGKRP